MTAGQILATVQTVGTAVIAAGLLIAAVAVATAGYLLVRHERQALADAVMWPLVALSALRPSARSYGRHARRGGAR